MKKREKLAGVELGVELGVDVNFRSTPGQLRQKFHNFTTFEKSEKNEKMSWSSPRS